MAKIPKLIKAELNFGRAKPEVLLAQGQAVLTGLTGNVNFTNPPVDLSVLKAALDGYASSIVEAKDGGRKAITLRNQQGENIIRMLRALAAYVEFNCKEDMNTFLSSGFRPRSSGRPTVQPLDQPAIDSLEQGISGELLAWIKRVRRAKTYEVRCGLVGPGGTAPASWLTKTVANARTAASIDGLTPGATYTIQVRAYGPLGYTEWSHAATRMCI